MIGDVPPDAVILQNGYYQDSTNFSGLESDILSLFSPLVPDYHNRRDIALHLRLGDYLTKQDYHPIISPGYIRRAVREQLAAGARPFLRIFSDSPNQAEDYLNFALDGIPVSFALADPGNSIDHLRALAGYDHLVCSNSTFSWWAAWLHRSISQIAFVNLPATWYGREYRGDWSAIYKGVTTGALSII